MSTTLRKTPLLLVTLWLLAMALGVMALVAIAGTAKAASVTPTQHDGNPTCKTLFAPEPAFEIKVDPPVSGSYGPLTVTFSPDGKLVDFTSTVPVLAVFRQGRERGRQLLRLPSSGRQYRGRRPHNPDQPADQSRVVLLERGAPTPGPGTEGLEDG